MNMKKKILNSLISIVVASIAYFMLFYYISANDIVSTLLTAGNQASIMELAMSLLFVALRFFIIVLLPGIVLIMAASLVWEYIDRKHKGNPVNK